MITSLTPEQESRLPLYRDKWIAKGLCTERVSLERATHIVHDFQEKVLKSKKTPVILCDDPVEAWSKVVTHVEDYGIRPANKHVESQVKSLFERFIKKHVEDRVHSHVIEHVFTSSSHDGRFVGYHVGNCIWNRVGNRRVYWVVPYLEGSFDAARFSFYDFFVEEKIITLEPELKSRLVAYMATSELGYTYPLEDVCIACQKPSLIRTNERGLHQEGGPALAYGEGFKIYALNGVPVPEYLAVTPSSQLDMGRTRLMSGKRLAVDTEKGAREVARDLFPSSHVNIVETYGSALGVMYVVTDRSIQEIRPWERIVFYGIGSNA